jgi:hypothetical protein
VKNPLDYLVDIIPAKARRYVYGAAGGLLFVWGGWQAAHGDVTVFLTSLASAVVLAMAHANTDPQPPPNGDGPRTVAGSGGDQPPVR